MTSWTVSDISPQTGRTAIVTGTGGLGYETALALARAGATVILAGRSAAKGNQSVARIKSQVPAAAITFAALDLADLTSVAAFAATRVMDGTPIEILVCNAGVMALPTRQTTKDNFELQFGTNYLGHYALTGRLLPLLIAGRARVVSLSSIAHRRGRIDFGDLNAEKSYKSWSVYGQSKLAMLMFALELQRRSDAAGWGLTSVAAHPGIARTALIENGPGPRSLMAMASRAFMPLVSHDAASGALPQLFAATDPAAKPGGYYGPGGFREMKGPLAPAEIRPQARDTAAAARLWNISAALTGVTFAALAPAAAGA